MSEVTLSFEGRIRLWRHENVKTYFCISMSPNSFRISRIDEPENLKPVVMFLCTPYLNLSILDGQVLKIFMNLKLHVYVRTQPVFLKDESVWRLNGILWCSDVFCYLTLPSCTLDSRFKHVLHLYCNFCY